MQISVSLNNQSFVQNKTKHEHNTYNKNNSDSFVHTTSHKDISSEQITFKGLLSKILKKKNEEKPPFVIPSPYILSLQKGIKEVFKEDIPTANFSSIISATAL